MFASAAGISPVFVHHQFFSKLKLSLSMKQNKVKLNAPNKLQDRLHNNVPVRLF